MMAADNRTGQSHHESYGTQFVPDLKDITRNRRGNKDRAGTAVAATHQLQSVHTEQEAHRRDPGKSKAMSDTTESS